MGAWAQVEPVDEIPRGQPQQVDGNPDQVDYEKLD
jgi:hypothetical protein